jgi:hypothetical protein
MKFRRLVFSSWCLIGAVSIISPIAHAVDRINVDFGLTEGSASLDLYIDNSTSSNELIFSQNEKLKLTKPSSQLLQTYYDYLVKNDTDGFLSLLSTSDGTQTSIVDYLKSNPDAYKRYATLNTVKTDMSIYWGTYQVHSLQLAAKNGSVFDWREVTQCISSCVYSNMLDHLDVRDQLFIEGVEYLKQEKKRRKLKIGDRKDFDNAINIFPSGFSAIQNVSQYPMRFFFEPQKLTMPAISLAKDCNGNKYSDKDVTAVIAVLCGIKNSDLSKDSITKVFSKMGIEVEEPAVIPIIKNVVTDEESEQIAESEGPVNTLPMFQTLLPIEQFVAAIKEWDSIQVVAKAFKNQRGIIYFKPSSEISKKYQAIQSIGIIRQGDRRQVLIVSEYALGQLPVSAFSANHVSNLFMAP